MFAGGGLNDLFDAFFGGQNPFGGGGGRRGGPAGPPRGQDLEVVADIAFEQAVFGATVPVTLKLPQRCADCGGSGAGAGTQPVTCSDCNGAGQVQRVRQSLLGQMVTTGRARAAAVSARSSSRRARRAAARAASRPSTRTRSTCPPASTPARRCG